VAQKGLKRPKIAVFDPFFGLFLTRFLSPFFPFLAVPEIHGITWPDFGHFGHGRKRAQKRVPGNGPKSGVFPGFWGSSANSRRINGVSEKPSANLP